MSGRQEKEMQLERAIKIKLKDAPSILEEYYYNLIGSGKSYETTYRYIGYVLSFVNFTFGEDWDEDFYKNVKPLHINKYITSLRTKIVTVHTCPTERGPVFHALCCL